MVEPDAHLGIYRLVSRIGAGGMGEVWKAEDTRLGRIVAIKILPAALAADAEATGRLRREARTAAQLNHPNIATIHAFDEADGRLYIVMEYVEGEALTNVIRRGPMAEAEVLRIGRTVADALAEAHAKGVVHRDIKPDNIVVNGPRLKVLDFGIAKRVDEPAAALPNDPTAFRTQTGFIIGTPHYMSPEQALGKAVDYRTDLFSLGVVLYECATGKLPFRGETVTETIMKIVRDEPEPARLSPELGAIVGRCLQKNPRERFPSAGELAAALDAQLAVAPTAPYTRRSSGPFPPAPPTVRTEASRAPRPRWPLIALISALAIVAGLAAIVILRPRPQAAPLPPKPVAVTTSSAIEAAATTLVEVAAPATTAVSSAAPATPTAPASGTVDAPAVPPRTADDFYNEGMARLVERQPFRAREAFQASIERDPKHARSHFRLGEMALFGRDFAEARRQLDLAIQNDGLEPRERKLAELGLAVLDRNRPRADQLLGEIAAMNARDPDLMRFRELVEGPQDRPFRGRRPRPRP